MIEVHINGEHKEGVQFRSLFISNRINQENDSCSFTMLQYGDNTYRPHVNDEVQVYVNGNLDFGGVIVEITQTLEEGERTVRYEVSCNDYSHYLNRRIITEKYESTNAQAVILDLMDKYGTEYGFTTTNVLGGSVAIASVAFNGLTFTECMDKLAELTGYYWYIDYNKDLHFFRMNDELAPFNLDDTEDPEDMGFITDSLEVKEGITQIRNLIKVTGDEAISDTRTQTIVAGANANERQQMNLIYKFAEKPTITVNGTPIDPAEVAVDYLESDTGNKVMWSFQQKYLRWTTGNVPAEGDVVEVTGDPLRPLIVQRQDDASIGTYGLFEHAIVDTKIKTRSEALKRAQTELRAYADQVNEAEFETYEPGLHSGQTISIYSELRGIDETFIIQAVTCKQITQDIHKYKVTLATTKTRSMLDFLQGLLLKSKIVDGEDETLIGTRQFVDEFEMSDGITGITHTATQDYVWEQNNPGLDSYPNPIIWNEFTWSA